MSTSNGHRPPEHFRVAIIGSGFGGLGMAIRLKQEGIEDFVVLERADDVGGTWRDNTYPGCQCDVASNVYSYSFAPNPDWSRTYSRQPEIRAYLRRCASDHAVAPHVRTGEEVIRASWQEEKALWRLETTSGVITADVTVAAIGPLSAPSVPDIPGLDRFEGTVFHSAAWDHDHDLSGERVAVIGTGASAIQFVPQIQPKVGELHLYQRTPPWVMPHTDRPTRRAERAIYRRFPATQRLIRSLVYWGREWIALGLVKQRRLMWPIQTLGRLHLRRQVRNRELRRKLTPTYAAGCKRMLVSNLYFPALTKANVEVVTNPIREVGTRSVITTDGTERAVDTIILGTGFLVTEMPGAEAIVGRGGRTLAEVFDGSPQAYLGTSIAGFPNAFMLLGPNTGLGHNSVIFMIEAQIEHVLGALAEIERREIGAVAVRPEVQEAFNADLQSRMAGTVWTAGGCASWYIDRKGRNTTLWPGFSFAFRNKVRRFDPDDYELLPAPSRGGDRVVGPERVTV